jgi:hypothetical protein
MLLHGFPHVARNFRHAMWRFRQPTPSCAQCCWAWLAELGADAIQGFVLSRPLPASPMDAGEHATPLRFRL